MKDKTLPTAEENYLHTIHRVKTMDTTGIIGELQIDENGNHIREVNGKIVIQIEEKTESDRITNEAINRWRCR